MDMNILQDITKEFWNRQPKVCKTKAMSIQANESLRSIVNGLVPLRWHNLVFRRNTIELKRCLEIVSEDDDDVTIEATPLSSKYPTIVDYKIYKEGKKSYFRIIRADRNSQNYLTFGNIFKNFNREDLEVLRSIVKERFKKKKPVADRANLLFQTLRTMFEHHVKDNIWKYQQGSVKVLHWKLFDSCGVHCITTKNMVYYLLVEKMYPFTNNILHQMWNDVRLQVDYEVEMAYDLLRLVRRQINEGYIPA
nr:hypothetical protein [Tanacetum cinerariifolium]